MKTLYSDGEPMVLGDNIVVGSDRHGLHGVIVAIIHDDQFAAGFEVWGLSKADYPRGVLVDTVEAGLILYDDDELLRPVRKLL
jgi:hypothetical protein